MGGLGGGVVGGRGRVEDDEANAGCGAVKDVKTSAANAKIDDLVPEASNNAGWIFGFDGETTVGIG